MTHQNDNDVITSKWRRRHWNFLPILKDFHPKSPVWIGLRRISCFVCIKATSHLSIFLHEMCAKGKIQRNNYQDGQRGPSFAGKTLLVILTAYLHARKIAEWVVALRVDKTPKAYCTNMKILTQTARFKTCKNYWCFMMRGLSINEKRNSPDKKSDLRQNYLGTVFISKKIYTQFHFSYMERPKIERISYFLAVCSCSRLHLNLHAGTFPLYIWFLAKFQFPVRKLICKQLPCETSSCANTKLWQH